MAEILQESQVPRRKTQIMFRSNLSFSQFKTYLKLLHTSNLIQREKGKFKITNKGQEFLQVYDQLVGLLRESPSKTEGKSYVPDALVYVKPLVNKGANLSDQKSL
jgi:predicted transcriptional regulator